MEFSHFGQQDQETADGDKYPRRDPEFSIAAGRIVTSGEAAAQQRRSQALRAPESIIEAALNKDTQPNEDDPNVETRHSAWHTYHVDKKTGQTLDNPDAMGKEFVRELQPEQNAAASQTLPSEPAAVQQTVQPIQSPIVPVLPRRRQQQFSSAPQQTYSAPGVTPTAQPPAGATPVEPSLPSGMQADEQHRLSAPGHPIARVIKSPWLWLVIGAAMIWYFTRG